MSIARPMNEYESALFSAVMILIRATVDLGIDRPTLAARFREAAQRSSDDHRESGAAVLQMLANLAEGGTYYVPTPPFTVIEGGKGANPSDG